jgi:hypothetical protein
MPGPYQHQYIFDARKTGWAETWYSDTASTLKNAHAAFQQTAGSRAACLAPTVILEALRTRDLGAIRLGITTEFGWGGGDVTAENRQDGTWNDIAYRIADATGQYRRTVNFRGVQDAFIAANAAGQFLPDPTFAGLVAAWKLAAFGPRGASLKFRALARGGANTPKTITAVGFAPPNPDVVYTCPAHGFVVGQFITVRGLRGENLQLLPPSKATLNGIDQVTEVIDANNFTLTTTVLELPAPPVIYRAGKAYPRNLVYILPFSMDYLKQTRRATGRPFFVPLGHRKALRKWS